MFEIELKAHVTNREQTVQKLNSFARFGKELERHDTYWRLFSKPQTAPISARIRQEIIKNQKETWFLTYKKKELIADSNGRKTEVNSENETELTNPKAVETILKDIGFMITDKKDKYISDWTISTPFGNATLELCNIPPLGDFLEIEILSPDNSPETVKSVQAELYSLLEKAGIAPAQVENRYYTDLLKEASVKSEKK